MVDEEDENLVGRIVTKLLSHAISRAHYYMTQLPASNQPPEQNLGDPKRIQSYIEVCLKTDNVALIGSIVAKLTDVANVQPQEAAQRAVTILLPLIPFIKDAFSTRKLIPDPAIGISRLCEYAITSSFDALQEKQPSRDDIIRMLQAIILSKDPTILTRV
jgi:hypothetical protein